MTEFVKNDPNWKGSPPLRLLDTLLFLISTSVYERWRTFPKNDWWRTFLTQNIKHNTNPPREDMIRTKFYVHNKSIHRGRTHFGLTLYFFKAFQHTDNKVFWCILSKVSNGCRAFSKHFWQKTTKRKEKEHFRPKRYCLNTSFKIVPKNITT